MASAMKLGQEGPLEYLPVWHSCRRTLEQVNGEERCTSRARLTDVDTDFVPLHRVYPSPFRIEGGTEGRYALIHNTTAGVVIDRCVAGRTTSNTTEVSRGGQITA
jgi:hypothetical protein